jgi:hypothetical protein
VVFLCPSLRERPAAAKGFRAGRMPAGRRSQGFYAAKTLGCETARMQFHNPVILILEKNDKIQPKNGQTEMTPAVSEAVVYRLTVFYLDLPIYWQ